MVKNLIIAALIGCLVWFGSALARVENQRYAYEVGLCSPYGPAVDVKKQGCSDAVETRSSPIWHLLYGLRVIG